VDRDVGKLWIAKRPWNPVENTSLFHSVFHIRYGAGGRASATVIPIVHSPYYDYEFFSKEKPVEEGPAS
jgi:hypothetical protein